MKNVIITGANSGLGLETAKKVAAKPDHKVILACRKKEKAEKAKEMIVGETGNTNVEVMLLDLASLDSVRAFAEAYIDLGEKIYALVNNAGIPSRGNGGATEDGIDRVLETNYLGHFILTQKLLPYMEEKGRIINVSSDMHDPPGGLTWPGSDTLLHAQGEDRRMYSYTKLCLIYLTHELDRRLKEEGRSITVNTFNPGFMSETNFSSGGMMSEIFVKRTMPERYGTLEVSSDVLASLLTSEEYEGISDQYFDRDNGPVRSSDLSYDKDHAKELYEKSLLYCGL